MLIKITKKCSMGCSHCINDAKPVESHMSEATMNSVLDFIIENEIYQNLVVSGGEPTEHPDFMNFMVKFITRLKTDPRTISKYKTITIATNGMWCIDHYNETKSIVDMNDNYTAVFFQVSTDKRFYPKMIDTKSEIFNLRNVILCEDCVTALYPQGRARNMEYNAKASKCYNVRAICKQLYMKGNDIKFSDIVHSLQSVNKICTPAIHYNGGIGLGESDLCPIATSIYDTNEDIVNKILNFKCDGCQFINDKLPLMYQLLLSM